MRNCKAFSLAIIQHGSAHAPMLGQDAPLSQVNGGGQVPLALPVLVTAQRTHVGQSMAARGARRLSRPLSAPQGGREVSVDFTEPDTRSQSGQQSPARSRVPLRCNTGCLEFRERTQCGSLHPTMPQRPLLSPTLISCVWSE